MRKQFIIAHMLWIICITTAFAEPQVQLLTGSTASPEVSTSRYHIKHGYVFVQGVYLSLPYHLAVVDSFVQVNGLSVSPSSTSVCNDMCQVLINVLESDGCIVVFSGYAIQVFERNDSYELLQALTDSDARLAFLNGKQEWLPDSVPHSRWIDWIQEFRCPADFKVRAEAKLAAVERVETSFANIRLARQVLDACVYPLAITGMLIVVVSFGHLMSYQPDCETFSIRNHLQSLWLVLGASTLDLVWTILASRTGEMKELNPLGAMLIDSPVALIALKASATLLAVSILFLLRSHRVARKGAWWICLICALLTERWLTVNSLLV